MNTHRITVLMRILLLKWIVVFIFVRKIFLSTDSKEIAALRQWLLISAALSSNADFYANGRSFFIDGVDHQYRDLDLPAEDSRITVRPPSCLAAPDFQHEWRYTIPEEVKPDCIASGASRGLPIRRRPTTARSSFAPAAAIIDVTGDDVPERTFPQYMDADQVLTH